MTTLTKATRTKIIKLYQMGSVSPQPKGKTMNAFLPEGYEAPSQAGNYMKFAQGENKIRILSAPILGWQDWTPDKKPVRFRYDNKPGKPIDPTRPVKHFWATIVWNYREERIQILQITQASIRSAIQALSENEDWGSPYFYDIKITKKGENVETEYNIAPSPHKPSSEAIVKAFFDKPCNLEALFEGTDPFADIANGFTPGIFSEEDAPATEPGMSPAQEAEIMELIGTDEALLQRILSGYSKKALSSIPAKHFAAIGINLKKRKA